MTPLDEEPLDPGGVETRMPTAEVLPHDDFGGLAEVEGDLHALQDGRVADDVAEGTHPLSVTHCGSGPVTTSVYARQSRCKSGSAGFIRQGPVGAGLELFVAQFAGRLSEKPFDGWLHRLQQQLADCLHIAAGGIDRGGRYAPGAGAQGRARRPTPTARELGPMPVRQNISSSFTTIPDGGSVSSPVEKIFGFSPGRRTAMDSRTDCTIQHDWTPPSK